ncbi:hypothetical protein BROUX41_004427 [Berkeleyomyces rouxiae]
MKTPPPPPTSALEQPQHPEMPVWGQNDSPHPQPPNHHGPGKHRRHPRRPPHDRHFHPNSHDHHGHESANKEMNSPVDFDVDSFCDSCSEGQDSETIHTPMSEQGDRELGHDGAAAAQGVDEPAHHWDTFGPHHHHYHSDWRKPLGGRHEPFGSRGRGRGFGGHHPGGHDRIMTCMVDLMENTTMVLVLMAYTVVLVLVAPNMKHTLDRTIMGITREGPLLLPMIWLISLALILDTLIRIDHSVAITTLMALMVLRPSTAIMVIQAPAVIQVPTALHLPMALVAPMIIMAIMVIMVITALAASRAPAVAEILDISKTFCTVHNFPCEHLHNKSKFSHLCFISRVPV